MSHSPVNELEVFGPQIRRSHVHTWIHGVQLCIAPTWPIDKRKEREFSWGLVHSLKLKLSGLCSKRGR